MMLQWEGVGREGGRKRGRRGGEGRMGRGSMGKDLRKQYGTSAPECYKGGGADYVHYVLGGVLKFK